MICVVFLLSPYYLFVDWNQRFIQIEMCKLFLGNNKMCCICTCSCSSYNYFLPHRSHPCASAAGRPQKRLFVSLCVSVDPLCEALPWDPSQKGRGIWRLGTNNFWSQKSFLQKGAASWGPEMSSPQLAGRTFYNGNLVEHILVYFYV